MDHRLDMGTGKCPVAHFPREGSAFSPPPQLAEWREAAPATRVRAQDGTEGWVVTRFQLAKQVLSDSRFSATHQRYPLGTRLFKGDPLASEAKRALSVGDVLSMDPPQHTRIRRSATSRLSVRAVREAMPRIRAYTASLLEGFSTRETIDLFGDFALPVSIYAHCEVLGVPDSMRERFEREFTTHNLDENVMYAFARQLLEKKREDLGEDAISDILRSNLTPDEQRGITLVLLRSGRDAVAYMISTITLSLLNAPDQLQKLRSNPGAFPAALEELLRFNALFVSTHPRTVLEDVTLEGIDFKAGDPVWISTVAANRDKERFEDPDVLDIDRDSYDHVTFGYGIHTCIGQQLARAVITDSIGQLLNAEPAMSLLSAEQTGAIAFEGNLPTYAPGAVMVRLQPQRSDAMSNAE